MTRTATADQLQADVERSFSQSPDRRLGEVMTAAVRHLHAFVAEVGPSTEEWRAAIDFLTARRRTSHATL